MQTVTFDFLRDVYPGREKWSHKGDHGRLLVIGGSRRYKGAPALCGMAALRTGVDLVVIAAPESAADVISGFSPNLIAEPLDGDYINPANIDKLVAMAVKFDAVAIGNGMGTMSTTKEAVDELLHFINRPCVLDADALHLIHDNQKVLRPGWVITPHEHEFYSLSGMKPGKKLEDRVKTVKKYSESHRATVLLKGYKDVIATGKSAVINSTGNPYMTVGGTGDVLCGIVGALLAMGIKSMEAAAAAAYLCGEAGNMAAADLGPGLLATDVIDRIPAVLKRAMG
ncbi:MAG: NAD(P)H-hydrate dehydratase [Candidatus Aenigmarchaeota archaeon]|nr:NAD(P)H-hydrate dehydratase [Candidatus Aenigmarchaeota archaeon]